VNFKKHSLGLCINSATKKTVSLIGKYADIISEVIPNKENVGTAEAINKIWQLRDAHENAIKMDDDVVIRQEDWIDLMEESISREPTIGQIGLKRKDLMESPYRDDFYKSELILLPHQPGERWIVIEKVNHVMGTCQMYSAQLLEKIGYLYQPKLYGFDDSLASFRSQLAGFINVFLPQIEIDHIDPGGTMYQSWKERHSGEQWEEYHQTLKDYETGKRSIYYNPFQ
jgi:GT2 family glycosyltransferase